MGDEGFDWFEFEEYALETIAAGSRELDQILIIFCDWDQDIVKTNMIGIKRTLGLSSQHLVKRLFRESPWICFLCVIFGLSALMKTLRQAKDRSGRQKWPLGVDRHKVRLTKSSQVERIQRSNSEKIIYHVWSQTHLLRLYIYCATWVNLCFKYITTKWTQRCFIPAAIHYNSMVAWLAIAAVCTGISMCRMARNWDKISTI